MKSVLSAARILALIVVSTLTLAYGLFQTGRLSYDAPRSTVHRIFDASMGDDSNSGGSGVMIAPRLMLTAAHVAKDRALLVGDARVPAKLLRIDEEKDLALLLVALDCPCAQLASAGPTVDTRMVAIGYPMSGAVEAQILTEGLFQGTTGAYSVLTAPIAPGNSGGGVFSWGGVTWVLNGIAVSMAGGQMGPFAVVMFPHLGKYASTESVLGFLSVRSTVELKALKPEKIENIPPKSPSLDESMDDLFKDLEELQALIEELDRLLTEQGY